MSSGLVSRLSRLRESPLFTRLAWGLGIAFVALHLLYGARAAHDRLLSNAEVFALGAIERAQTLAEVVQYDPALLERLSTEDFSVAVATTLPREPIHGWKHSAEVEQAVRLLQARSDSEIAGLWFESDSEGPRRHQPRLVIVLPQGDRWLQVSAVMRMDRWRNPPAGALGTAALALLIFGAALWGTRRVTRFLPRFADAAERVGQGQEGGAMALEGPREVRRAARAFNDMQARVADHVAERSTMMAAFSHDLRTLATRLALRVESVPDDAVREPALADVSAMTRILDEALAFARDEASTEARTPIDLQALLQTLLDEAASGAALRGRTEPLTASLQVPADAAGWKIEGQPVALQRAFANLIDNAIAYGGDVWLRLERQPAADGQPGVAVCVCDPGPGIPEADWQRVTKAYVRLERSRNRQTGGTGLGLAIVSNVIRRHGGELSFARPAAGPDPRASGDAFCVRVWLPGRASAGATPTSVVPARSA